ncbi:hypothetical protein [Nocardia brasiliensis]
MTDPLDNPGVKPLPAWRGPFVPEQDAASTYLVATTDTAARLARSVVRYEWSAARLLALFVSMSGIGLAFAVVAALAWGPLGYSFVAAELLVISWIFLAVGYFRRHRLTVAHRSWLYPGACVCAHFGAYAFDIQTVRTYEKFLYRELTEFKVRREVVVLAGAWPARRVLPRELFSDGALHMIKQRRASGC